MVDVRQVLRRLRDMVEDEARALGLEFSRFEESLARDDTPERDVVASARQLQEELGRRAVELELEAARLFEQRDFSSEELRTLIRDGLDQMTALRRRLASLLAEVKRLEARHAHAARLAAEWERRAALAQQAAHPDQAAQAEAHRRSHAQDAHHLAGLLEHRVPAVDRARRSLRRLEGALETIQLRRDILDGRTSAQRAHGLLEALERAAERLSGAQKPNHLRDDFGRAKAEAAHALGLRERFAKRLAQARALSEAWSQKSAEAMEAGDFEWAEDAMEQSVEHADLARRLQQAWDEQEAATSTLGARVKHLGEHLGAPDAKPDGLPS